MMLNKLEGCQSMLKVENLSSGYGTITILRDFSLEVERGKTITIIGRNGVGKSTFIKTLIGLIPAKSGRILYNGKDITAMKTYERAKMGIGYVPQGHGVFPLLTVEENLKMGKLIATADKDKSLQLAFDYFPRLYERRSQKAGTLSGGEQAMLSIARAILGEPSLLLLDEPSEGIQPNLAAQLGDIVRLFSRDLNMSVIMAEQHIGLIQMCSDKCFAVDKGIVVGRLSSEEVQDYQSIKHYLTL